ncbi:MAG: SDR family NAD(P)-dependent oxidoreductase [Treponema sp.]|jgi:NAD(P)-dependent dehydrogenase (short-subunit alcohol dehydrogenase family)|nr:SDR family NAD(P)-dependent oxidoreductase [Treponema sp.]
MDLGLENRVALITGGSVGIGLAVAEEFLREKADVIICARNGERIEKVVEDLKASYPGSIVYGKSCDVSKLVDIESLAAYVKELGGVDILINNAGTGSEEKSMTALDEKWYYYWDLHVMAAVRLSRLLVPQMKERPGEGVIINTTSMCATQPLYYEPIYNTTKAALNMYTKCLADELIKDNIRVMSIAPGLVLTPDWYKTAGILSRQQGISVQQYFDNIAQAMTPIGRFATAEETAKLYVFLASKQAGYCLGATFHIDAGAVKTIY